MHSPLSLINPAIIAAVVAICAFCRVASAEDNQPVTIDDLGFNQAMNQQVFKSRYQFSSKSSLSNPFSRQATSLSGAKTGVSLETLVDVESSSKNAARFGDGLNFSDEAVENTTGFQVKRFSTALKNSKGTLTVGNDWSNFQDFLGGSKTAYFDGVGNQPATSQIRWQSDSGFGLAIEDELDYGNDNDFSPYQSSPNLILSWDSEGLPINGKYSFTALGRQLELDGFQAEDRKDKKLGWGVNLSGGWQFGDLFAALSVTIGNSIDNIILGRFGNGKTTPATSRTINLGDAYNINPSLNYRLNDTSNLHVAINRYESDDINTFGIDTLDTIHVGYTWKPWPSTRFGIEFVGKDVEGDSELTDSKQVNFAASKQF